MRVSVRSPGRGALELDDGLLVPFRAALAELGKAEPVRLAFAAAHVVAAEDDEIDWTATRRLREHLDRCGFAIAEAMDTAQRHLLGWNRAYRLIREEGKRSRSRPFIAGAGVDHLSSIRSLDDVIEGVVHQARAIQAAGGWPMLLSIPWLSEQGLGPEQYVELYESILGQLQGPLFVHWLGSQFQPALEGYFPGDSFRRVMALDPDKVRGCKLSLLDPGLEKELRRELLARQQIVLTGDDLHFAELIEGEPGPSVEIEVGGTPVLLGPFSHALLGILDAIAEPAGRALQFLAHGRREEYRELMRPCERLGRWLFRHPTRHYKAGLAFLAWVNGLQDHPYLLGREDRARDRDHCWRALELAQEARVIRNAELAAARLGEWESRR